MEKRGVSFGEKGGIFWRKGGYLLEKALFVNCCSSQSYTTPKNAYSYYRLYSLYKKEKIKTACAYIFPFLVEENRV